MFYSNNTKGSTKEGLFSTISYCYNLSFVETYEGAVSDRVDESVFYQNVFLSDGVDIRKTNYDECLDEVNNSVAFWYLSTNLNTQNKMLFVTDTGFSEGLDDYLHPESPDYNDDGIVVPQAKQDYYNYSDFVTSLGNLKEAWIFLNIKGGFVSEDLVNLFFQHGAALVIASYSNVTYNGSGRFFFRLLEQVCKNEFSASDGYYIAMNYTSPIYLFGSNRGDPTINYVVFGDGSHF